MPDIIFHAVNPGGANIPGGVRHRVPSTGSVLIPTGGGNGLETRNVTFENQPLASFHSDAHALMQKEDLRRYVDLLRGRPTFFGIPFEMPMDWDLGSGSYLLPFFFHQGTPNNVEVGRAIELVVTAREMSRGNQDVALPFLRVIRPKDNEVEITFRDTPVRRLFDATIHTASDNKVACYRLYNPQRPFYV